MISRDTLTKRLLQVLAVYGILVASVVGFLVLLGEEDPDKRAVVAMGLGLILFWCILGGAAMYLARERFVRWAQAIPLGWRLRFVLLCIAMALLEEVVTTSLTNTASLLGATEAARITSSTNYLEVISGSVVAFIPWFIFWAWFLGRYDFKPPEVMLLLGLTGTLAETITFGYDNLAGIGMWVYVYGLMIYLPVHTVPGNRNVHPVRWYHVVVAVLLPLVFIIPFALYVLYALLKRIVSALARSRASSDRQ